MRKESKKLNHLLIRLLLDYNLLNKSI